MPSWTTAPADDDDDDGSRVECWITFWINFASAAIFLFARNQFAQGENGTAISFICEYGAYLVQDLEETIGQEIKCEQPTEEMLVMPKRNRN